MKSKDDISIPLICKIAMEKPTPDSIGVDLLIKSEFGFDGSIVSMRVTHVSMSGVTYHKGNPADERSYTWNYLMGNFNVLPSSLWKFLHKHYEPLITEHLVEQRKQFAVVSEDDKKERYKDIYGDRSW